MQGRVDGPSVCVLARAGEGVERTADAGVDLGGAVAVASEEVDGVGALLVSGLRVLVEPAGHPGVGLIPDIVDLGTLRARERPGDHAARPIVASADGFEIGELKSSAGGQLIDVVVLDGQVGGLLKQAIELAGVVRESLEQLRERAWEALGVDDEPEVDVR